MILLRNAEPLGLHAGLCENECEPKLKRYEFVAVIFP